jgi:hypothetical protein
VGGDSISAEYHLGLLLLLIDLGGFVAPAIQLAQKCSTDWPILYWGSGLVDMPELEEPRCSVMATRSSTFMRLPSCHMKPCSSLRSRFDICPFSPPIISLCWACVGWQLSGLFAMMGAH